MTASDAPALDPYRLPRAAVPTRYDIELAPELAAATFDGRVRIVVDIVEPVQELVLNAIELEVGEVRVDGSDVSWSLVPETERLVIRPVGGLEPGMVEVVISFQGVLNDKLRGFYRSTYRDDDGTEHVIATTQMQATDCRRAFPCWDEPDFKAVFGITLVVDPDLLAVSNGPEIERAPRPDGKLAIRFADTMVMSTYLVAFVVGPLVATEPTDVDGVPLRIVHVPRQGAPHRGRPRRRRLRPALVPGVLRHPLPQRQGRSAGPSGLRRRRDGEPRLHHLPREPPPHRPRDRDDE